MEDRVCDNKLSICFNNHRELCGVDIEGCACLSQELLMNCSNQAAITAVQLVDKIKSAIHIDNENRYITKNNNINFNAIHIYVFMIMINLIY